MYVWRRPLSTLTNRWHYAHQTMAEVWKAVKHIPPQSRQISRVFQNIVIFTNEYV